MDKNYLDVLAKNVLNEIKNYLKRNFITLEGEKEVITDQKMIEIIKSLLEEDCRKIDITNSLIQYYMALYNDNMELLHKMLDTNNVVLIALDKRLSSNFEIDEYLDILNGNETLFKNFYFLLFTIRNKKQIDSKELIVKFCDILKVNKNIARTNIAYYEYLPFLLNIKVLTNFSKNEILSLNDAQKVIADSLEHQTDENTINFMIDLIKKCNHPITLNWWFEFRKYFSLVEMANFTTEEALMYANIICNNRNKKNLDKLIAKTKRKIGTRRTRDIDH